MTPDERLALHRRLGAGMIEAFTSCADRQRVDYPAEYSVSQDAVMWLPAVSGGVEYAWGKDLATSGLTPSERTTQHFQAYWQHLPDFRAIDHGPTMVSDLGFAHWIRFGGTTTDGRRLTFFEADHVYTNETGEVSRYEAFLDWKEFGPVLALVTGLSPDMTWEDYRTAVSQSQD
jgi:hypothetical protein